MPNIIVYLLNALIRTHHMPSIFFSEFQMLLPTQRYQIIRLLMNIMMFLAFHIALSIK